MKNQVYYLGLDIGSDSVGYSTTDTEYNLLKYNREPMWGVTVFDAASDRAKRRAFRCARRRLDRRQQRVSLVRELFAPEVAKVDEKFFINIQGSGLFRDDAGVPYPIFNDDGYTDKEFYAEYPTIHHLITDLMNNPSAHDVRHVCLAVSWLVAHRGHFLTNISLDNLGAITDFDSVYNTFIQWFELNGYDMPWAETDKEKLAEVLKNKTGVRQKKKALKALLFGGKTPDKHPTEEFPFSRDHLITFLAGGEVGIKDLFCNDDFEALGSVTIFDEEEKFLPLVAELGDDYDLLDNLRKIYDWVVLVDVLGRSQTISEAKVKVYETHKADLETLKYFLRNYASKKTYLEVFSDKAVKTNYPAYTQHANGDGQRTCNVEDFSKYLLKIIGAIKPEEKDEARYNDMKNRLELRTFLPKQKNSDNRVIPHQLYLYELIKILEKAENYLPFLCEKDEDGLSVSDKLIKVFSFRVPYFVGPLNSASSFAWVKPSGKVLPWNFDKVIDLDKSEQAFIEKLTNTCTYLPGETVLPKDSLLYHEFTVLNEINNLKINNVPITVEQKQAIYNELFMANKKVSAAKLKNFMVAKGYIAKGEEDTVTGIDATIKSNLSSQVAFRRLIADGILSVEDCEKIIERSTYAEDKTRLVKWLDANYPTLCADDKKYIASLKLSDFGRLSRRLLTGIYGVVDKGTGEAITIIDAMRNHNYNFMELLSDKFTFRSVIDEEIKEYYAAHPMSLNDRLDDMYISNAVKRPIFRALDIVADVVKATGHAPAKIFVETTRSDEQDKKGKTTTSRKDAILALYEKCRDEDVRDLRAQIEAMGDYANNKLQSEKLFLYYIQLGKCMYSGEEITFTSDEYNVDHIYPQAFVKDDSVLNNKVLVKSTINGTKDNIYPLDSAISSKMHDYWTMLKDNGLITDEKYKRLTRKTPFTEEEKLNFINRQLVETSQATKAVASILKEKYPETEIVYCKAKLASDFRKQFDVFKSRKYNELHHAVDAYLNIVTGNVYHSKFTKNFSTASNYSIKTKTIFNHELIVGNETVWDGKPMLEKAIKIARKSNAHFTILAHYKNGGLFDQMPVTPRDGLVPRKAELSTEKYGGYNGSANKFFIPVKYSVGKKTDIYIMPVEMRIGDRFLSDEEFAKDYTKEKLSAILGKEVAVIGYPLGLKPWKVNTVLSFDGFRGCITGSGGKGKLRFGGIMQFSAGYKWQFYLKKLENLTEKVKNNPNYKFDSIFDNVTAEENLELYDIYIDKLNNSVYKNRKNNSVAVLENGRDLFVNLTETEQANTLLNIHTIFGRLTSGCDLTAVLGVSSAARNTISTNVSNWKKDYKDVRLVSMSPSGIWETKSVNLLDLL